MINFHTFHSHSLGPVQLRYRLVWIVLCYSPLLRGMPVFVHGSVFAVWAVNRGYTAGFGTNRRRETKVKEEHVKGKQREGRTSGLSHVPLCTCTHTHTFFFSTNSQK